jgi:hypothetical protein
MSALRAPAMREARTWDFSGLMGAYLSLPYYYTLLGVLFLHGFVKACPFFSFAIATKYLN